MTSKQSRIINRFGIPGEEGYSEFWRRNKSPIETIELANLLLALRKIVSYVGRNVGAVVWTGMDYSSGIALDPKPVVGRYPIPAAKADRMVGIAVQQAYLKTEWSARFRAMAQAKLKLPTRHAYKFQLFFDTCEKVYVDALSNRSVLAYYTEYARKLALQYQHDVASHPPTISELLHLWWDLAADRSGSKHKQEWVDRSVRGLSKRTSLEKYYKAPITLLNSIVERLIWECPKIGGVTERGKFRLNLYLSIWPDLFKHIQFWPTDSMDPFLQARPLGKNILRLGAEKDDHPAEGLRLFAPAEATQGLPQRKPELTEQVREIVEKEETVRVAGNDIVMRATNRINKKLLYHLKFIIKAAAQRKTTANRGLRTGKIDRRRLYRAQTTGAVFQFRKDDFELRNDIILLVDATGSMSAPKKWEHAEEIFQTIFSAVKAFNRNARLFAYNEIKGVCQISELYLGEKFYTILPHGKTASGEAVIATALTLKGKQKSPFIIHLTDGASNWGCGVSHAIQFCKKNRINLLTLGIGCDAANKDLLLDEYERLVQFVDRTDDLPHLIRALLNHSKWN